MLYQDRVYGQAEIDEPVVLELMASPAMQRLKDIDQAGYFEPYFPGTRHSRFEHSVGVYLLLKKYSAPLEEQIAGLIHDVSHSAFSHCIDYVLAGGVEEQQSHQDNVFDDFVRRTDIPAILAKHGFDLDHILDDSYFPLKEQDLPDLCADRIDYSFRVAVVFKELTVKQARELLAELITQDGRWIFRTVAAARQYAELFRRMNTKYWSGLESAAMFRTVGDYLRHALQQKYISAADLYLTDKVVLDKVAKFHATDERLRLLFERMNGRVAYKNDPADFEAEVRCKSRVVDPLCFAGGTVKRLSEVEPDWKAVVAVENKPKSYFLKFEK